MTILLAQLHQEARSRVVVEAYATSWKVEGSKPEDTNEFFQFT
jgi:hypothetical protein